MGRRSAAGSAAESTLSEYSVSVYARSWRSPYRHHAEPGVEVYVDVQNQGAWPSGKRAKFSHGPCDNRDAEFNFDPQIVAVAEEMLLHRLDCLD